MNVSTTVVAACKNLSTTAISFPSVSSPVPANFDATGSVIVTCSAGTPFSIALDSPNLNSQNGNFVMVTGNLGIGLAYNVYAPGQIGTQLWGNGIANGTAVVNGIGTGVPLSFIATGRIISGQTGMQAGAYADQITVTISF
jgi:spore coat protein U-like protein